MSRVIFAWIAWLLIGIAFGIPFLFWLVLGAALSSIILAIMSIVFAIKEAD